MKSGCEERKLEDMFRCSREQNERRFDSEFALVKGRLTEIGWNKIGEFADV